MSLTRREIAQQPAALAAVLDRAPELAPAIAELRACRRVALVGRGSSGNAGLYAEHLFGRYAGRAVSRLHPSLQSVYGRPARLDDAFVIAISQSGRSPDVVEVVAGAAQAGRPTLAITNDPASPLAAVAHHVFDLGVGTEEAVAATKTYTASLAALALLVVGLLDDEAPGAGDLSRGSAELELAAVPAAVERALAVSEEPARDLAVRLGGARNWMVSGRGPNLATAAEAALKILELTGTPAAGHSPAELQHGPVAALGPEAALLGIAFDGPARESVEEAFEAATLRGAGIAEVGDRADALPIAPIAEWLSPFPATVAAQLLAVALSERGEVETDTPFGLRKVTLTR